MKKHFMLVFTNAVEGREDDFNDWYSNVHIQDLVALDGFDAAQRFELTDLGSPQTSDFKYLAIYEVPEDKIDDARAALSAAAGTPNLVVSDALARPPSVFWFTSITDRIEASH